MENKKLSQAQLDLLKKPLPKEAVKQHPTKTFLSSIKAVYVTERFNDVFGVGAWQVRVNHVTTTDKSMVVVKVEFSVPEYGIFYECFGGNDNGGENSKNFDLGDAYKGATTDALTKIGSYLGVGIDVFKGLQNGNSQPQQPTTPTLDVNRLNTRLNACKTLTELQTVYTSFTKAEQIATKDLATKLKTQLK